MDQGKKFVRKRNPKEKANCFSVATFFYAYKIIWKGFKTELEEEDICEISKHMKSKKVGDKLEKVWLEDKKNKERTSILKVITKCYGLKFIIYGFLQLLLKSSDDIITPLAIGKVVDYFSPESTMTDQEVYSYSALVISYKFLEVFLSQNYYMILFELGITVKASFSSLIYRKCLKLSPEALAEYNSGKIITLITKDVQAIATFALFGNDIWLGVAEAIVICCALYRRIGIITFLGIGLVVLVIPLQVYLSKKLQEMRLGYCQKSDVRIQRTQEAITNIKIIKMYTWEFLLDNVISESRKAEVKNLLLMNFISSALHLLGLLIAHCSMYVVLMVYIIYYSEEVTAENIFFIVSCFDILRDCFADEAAYGIRNISNFITSLRRVLHLLEQDELPAPAPALAPESAEKNFNDPSKCKIEFSNACFRIKNSEVIKNISCEISAGLNIVTGHLGSGKSSFLKMILQEYQPTTGSVQVNGRISYASQDPWLFPASIRNNILFGDEFNENRYRNVLTVCALNYDLDILVNGDETIVEDNGMNLSKGQQARINLARAIYRQSDIYLLDDCLAALDVTVQEHIFKKCIKGLLSDKICIWVTHNIKSFKTANQIIVMKNGSIEAIKSPPDIINEQQYSNVGEMNEKNFHQNETESDDKNELIDEQTALLLKIDAPKKNIYRETKKIGGIEFSVIKNYFKFGGFWLLAVVLILFAISKITYGWSSKTLSFWVNLKVNTTLLLHQNQTATEEYNSLMENEGHVFRMFTVSLVLSLASILVRDVGFFCYISRISINIHKVMIKSILNAAMEFYDNTFIGNILNRFSRDICLIDERFSYILSDCIKFVGEASLIFVLVATVNVAYLIPSVVIFIILVIVRWFYMHSARSLMRLETSTRSPLVGHINASLEGITTIRAYNKASMILEEFDRHQDLYNAATHMSVMTERGFSMILSLLADFYICYVICDLVFFNIADAGNVGLALTKAISLTSVLNWGIRGWAQFEILLTSVERVLEYTHVKFENKTGLQIKNWPNTGSLEYDNVSLKYEKTGETVLKGLSFTIKPREKIGIVGRTGAGKTSILSTLFRLYEVDGKILLDNVDCKTVSLEQLRSGLSLIPQDPILFQGTIRSNIDPRGEYSDEDIWRALEQVRLREVVQKLDDPVGDGGNEFSTGQRQLFCLARALVKRNRIIVLDEATANMDPETEALITGVVEEEFAQCTVLTVAHKLATVMKADRVMVLDRGQLMEFDSPQNLLRDDTSRFYQMVQDGK